jgi:5-methylcytosine-specific restriction protein A
MPTVEEFRAELRQQLRDAELRGASHLEVNSGALHRKLGGYPEGPHQMPSCCDAMYGEQKAGDVILAKPPKGKGASLTISYKLPRRA